MNLARNENATQTNILIKFRNIYAETKEGGIQKIQMDIC